MTTVELLKPFVFSQQSWNSGESNCSVDLTKLGACGAESWVNLSLIMLLCMACSLLWLFVVLSIVDASEAGVLGIAMFCCIQLIKLRS